MKKLEQQQRQAAGASKFCWDDCAACGRWGECGIDPDCKILGTVDDCPVSLLDYVKILVRATDRNDPEYDAAGHRQLYEQAPELFDIFELPLPS